MNIKEYISTGILEAYALGELSEGERIEVEKNLQQHSALREELALIEETMEVMFQTTAIQPRAALRQNLFEKIKSAPQGKVVAFNARNQVSESIQIWKYATAASFVVALLSSYLASNYRSLWKETESNLNNLIAQNQRIAQDDNNVNFRLDKIETDLQITNNPDFFRIIMKGTANTPQSLASVYWNANTKEVYLSIQNMKELAKENQYQLWAIIDGKPVDCGVFDATITGLLKMKDAVSSPTTFAVTIEPRGGKLNPTLETMQVAGNLVKG